MGEEMLGERGAQEEDKDIPNPSVRGVGLVSDLQIFGAKYGQTRVADANLRRTVNVCS